MSIWVIHKFEWQLRIRDGGSLFQGGLPRGYGERFKVELCCYCELEPRRLRVFVLWVRCNAIMEWYAWDMRRSFEQDVSRNGLLSVGVSRRWLRGAVSQGDVAVGVAYSEFPTPQSDVRLYAGHRDQAVLIGPQWPVPTSADAPRLDGGIRQVVDIVVVDRRIRCVFAAVRAAHAAVGSRGPGFAAGSGLQGRGDSGCSRGV